VVTHGGKPEKGIAMTLTTTFKRLREAHACSSRYEFLRKALPRKKYGDDTPINLLTILEMNGLDDALWALHAVTTSRAEARAWAIHALSICDPELKTWETNRIVDSLIRLMAADFAEEVLPIWQKYAPDDKRPELAIKAARDFANGRIFREALAATWAAAGAAAGDAARDAAWAAWHAARAAWHAAWAAAGDAAGGSAGAAARAARDAAGDARDAAWDAAQQKQREIFTRYLQPAKRKVRP
jgi:hypothetical protein